MIDYMKLMISKKEKGFTLMEVLVVVSTIGLLMAILLPALSSARSQAYGTVCRSNLRQLVLANISYSNENNGYCVPAASDMGSSFFGGCHRWHGVREDKDEPFDPRKGPLACYLADGEVRECPYKVGFVKGDVWEGSFEKGCGGYGYNMTYIGSCVWQRGLGFSQRYERTPSILKISQPDETLMFADCAMSIEDNSYIEYSFAEPPYVVMNGRLYDVYSSPSIHFRHRGRANVGWADGHISEREMADMSMENVYNVASERMMLGWFEPVDNSLFDLK